MIKIMLDASPAKIKEYSARYEYEFWQLRTPLTKYAIAGTPYGLDNGCFKEFREKDWLRLLEEAEEVRPVFVCLPDIVGDARRTLDLFEHYSQHLNGYPKALVLQDGIGGHPIPWNEITAIFIGGSDNFKISSEAFNAAKVAKMLGKWVHVGRVNTVNRLKDWIHIADSIDGSGISRFDHMLEEVLAMIKGEIPHQHALEVAL